MDPRVIRTRRNIMKPPDDRIRGYSDELGLSMLLSRLSGTNDHDWSLVSALLERWRPKTHSFHMSCGEMSITLQDVAYQLGLRIDGDPVSGCISGWELHYDGRGIETMCRELLGAIPT